MAYKYQEIWDTIKANRKAEITVSESYAPTVIQGVKRTKCAENSTRSLAGLVPWSKLVIRKEELDKRGTLKVTFELLYDTRL